MLHFPDYLWAALIRHVLITNLQNDKIIDKIESSSLATKDHPRARSRISPLEKYTEILQSYRYMKTKFLEYEKNNQKTKRVFCVHFGENYGANFLFIDCFWQQEYFVPSTTTWTRGLGKAVELCREGRHQGTVEKFKGKLGRTLDYIDPILWLYSSRLADDHKLRTHMR